VENSINKINKINIYFMYSIYSGGSFENLINKINIIDIYFVILFKGNTAGIFSRQIVQKGLCNNVI
jgi:hypothetical protein